MPEWQLVILALAVCSLLAVSWPPLLIALPILAVFVALTLIRSLFQVWNAPLPVVDGRSRLLLRMTTAWLHLVQPFARLAGRLGRGLTFWRCRTRHPCTGPLARQSALWTTESHSPEDRIAGIVEQLRRERVVVRSGDEFSRWDLEVQGGMFGGARLLLAVEDHGAGAQYVRTSIRPCLRCGAGILVGVLSVLTLLAAVDGAPVASVFFGSLTILLAACVWRQMGAAATALVNATHKLRPHESAQ